MNRHVYLVGDEVKSTVLDDAILCAANMEPKGELRMHPAAVRVLKEREDEAMLRYGLNHRLRDAGKPSIVVRIDGRVPLGQVHVTAPQ